MGACRPSISLGDQIDSAVRVLRNGGVVAIPTDTLYGLAACTFDAAAVERVFRLKGRSQTKAVPLLLAEPGDVDTYAVDVPALTWVVVEHFWPGALTLVLRKARAIPDAVSGGADTVALRVPDHLVPRAVARELGMPITGTSANRAGSPELTTAAAVRAEFGHEVDLVVDGGSTPGLASTVLDLSGDKPRVLRHGAVPQWRIEEVCGLTLAA